MHATPLWQQGSNVTLDFFVSTLTLGGMWQIRDFRSCTCYLLRDVNRCKTIRFQLYYYYVDLLLKEGGGKGCFETCFVVAKFQRKTSLRHMLGWTTVQDFNLTFPPHVCTVDWLRQDGQNCSWWSDSIRKQSNCIISLSTGPLSRVHPISCSLSPIVVGGGSLWVRIWTPRAWGSTADVQPHRGDSYLNLCCRCVCVCVRPMYIFKSTKTGNDQN